MGIPEESSEKPRLGRPKVIPRDPDVIAMLSQCVEPQMTERTRQ